MFTVGLNRAVSVLADKAAGKGARRGAPSALRNLGDHPEKCGKIEVFSGRYGPYVKHAKTNATIPKDTTPEEITLERAVQLIDEREAKVATKKKAPAKKKTAAKKATTKKATAKKPAAKKSAAKKTTTKKTTAKKTSAKKTSDPDATSAAE